MPRRQPGSGRPPAGKGTFYRTDDRGVLVDVRLTPKGGRDAIDGVAALSDGRAVLAARVSVAPEKGAANAALAALLAARLGVPKSAVSLVSGATGRVKTLRVAGDPGALVAAIEALGGPG